MVYINYHQIKKDYETQTANREQNFISSWNVINYSIALFYNDSSCNVTHYIIHKAYTTIHQYVFYFIL